MPTPRSSSVRTGVERRSAVLLAWLSQQPKLLLPAAVLGLLLLSAFLPPLLSTLCLVPVVALLSWLTYLSWPALDLRARTLRLLVLVGLLVLAALGLQ